MRQKAVSGAHEVHTKGGVFVIQYEVAQDALLSFLSAAVDPCSEEAGAPLSFVRE